MGQQLEPGGSGSIVGLFANSPAANEWARFTDPDTLEGRTNAELISDAGLAAASHTHAAADITSGTLANARGGTGADTSATGGAGQVVQQASVGAAFTLGLTPTHAARHMSGGADAIKLDELAAPTDVTTLNVSATAHGLVPKFPNNTTTFFRGDGIYAAPVAGGSGNDLCVVFEPGGTAQGTANTDTVLEFNSEGYDPGAMHSTVTNKGRLTINTTGKYLIFANINGSVPASGASKITFYKNGVAISGAISAIRNGTIGELNFTLVYLADLVATDYIEVTGNNSAVNGGFISTDSFRVSTFGIVKVG